MQEDLLVSELPDVKGLRQLRACMFCSLVQTQQDFEVHGCTNCENVLRLKGNKGRVIDCTSPNFQGLVSMMDPESSWVARWQQISGQKYALGLYAISVYGNPPEYIIRDFESETGKEYIPRSRET